MKCKLCRNDKPNAEFDLGPKGKPISWCKECRALCERALRGYTKWAPRPRADWPDTWLQDAKSISAYMELGGVPFRKQKVMSMLSHLDWQPEASTDSIEVSAEAFMYLMDRVEELERLINTRAHLGMSNADELDAQARRFTDAVNKLVIPELSHEDLTYYKAALRDCYTEVKRRGYPSPSTVRSLVAPLELASAAMPLELVRIYNAIIFPALLRAQESEEYSALVEELIDLTGTNYYEVDWLDIPLESQINEEAPF